MSAANEVIVEEFKAKGNACFAKGAFQEAVDLYNQAIDAASDNAVLYSNRSAALLRLGRVSEARADAEQCLTLRPDWEKAHYRLGAVCEQEGNLDEVSRHNTEICDVRLQYRYEYHITLSRNVEEMIIHDGRPPRR
jgi:tetratricopeptide (TPR) repeat protein